MFKITVFRTLQIFKVLLFYVVLYVGLYFLVNKYVENSPVFILHILFIPMFLGFAILYFNHLYFSFKKIETRGDKLYVDKEPVERDNILFIELNITKTVRNRLPWDSGNIYYYEIILRNGDLIFITSLMDRKNLFEKWLADNNYSFEVNNSLFPFILPSWATR